MNTCTHAHSTRSHTYSLGIIISIITTKLTVKKMTRNFLLLSTYTLEEGLRKTLSHRINSFSKLDKTKTSHSCTNDIQIL